MRKLDARTFRHADWIAVVTAVGLVSALIVDGAWDSMFCALLAVPVAAGCRFALRQRGVS
jgi:hypothetical protein